MKPSDCISGKWYYFKWLFHSQPVYFKYNMTRSSNILVGSYSIWKTSCHHGGAYREDEIEDAQEQLEADLKATSRKLKLERQELLCLKSAEALDFQAIFAKIDLIEGLEQAVMRFEKLKEELF